jgi:hypothetical protein
VAARVDRRADRFQRGVHHIPQPQSCPTQFHLVPADAGHVEQVVDEPHHMTELAVHHFPRPAGRSRVIRGQPHDLEAVPQRGEWVPQLVGEQGQKLVFPPVGVPELLDHPLPFRVGPPAGGDVGKQDGDPTTVGRPDPEGVYVKPTVQGLVFVGEPDRLAGLGQPSVIGQPMPLDVRNEFPHAPADIRSLTGSRSPNGLESPGRAIAGRGRGP